MTDSLTPRLALPLMQPAQAQKHITHNEALIVLDGLVHIALNGLDVDDLPLSPSDGEAYMLSDMPSDPWSAHGGDLARWNNSRWDFQTPQLGWTSFDISSGTLLVFDGGWRVINSESSSGETGPSRTDRVSGLGIGADADSVNRLSLVADGALFSHGASGDHRLVLNREDTGKSASLIFQTGFQANAEFGMTSGGSDFGVRIFDGTLWHDAMRIDALTGRVAFPSGGVREQLTAPRTYYVDPNGDNNQDGLTAQTAFATLQKGIDTALALDPLGHRVTLQMAEGLHTQPASVLRAMFDGGELFIRGNPTNPMSTRLETGSSPALTVQGGATRLHMDGLHLEGIVGLWGRNGARIGLSGGNSFGACAARQIGGDNGAYFEVFGDLYLDGESGYGLLVDSSAHLLITAATLHLAQNTNFPGGYVRVVGGGLASISNITLSGSASGPHYHVSLNGTLNTYGAGAASLPGDSAGNVDTGGQFV